MEEHHSPLVHSNFSNDAVRIFLIVSIFVLYPFHRVVETGFTANLSFADPIIGIVLVLWVTGTFGSRTFPRYTWLIGAFVAFSLVALVINTLNSVPYFSLRVGIVELVKLVGSIAWFAGVSIIAVKRPTKYVPVAAAASVIMATAFTVLAIFDVVFLETARQTGPFHNPNIFGNYLILNGCLALYVRETWISDRSAWATWLPMAAAGILLSGILATGSRGSVLGVVVAGTIILTCSMQLDRRQRVVVSVSALVTTFTTLLLIRHTAPSLVNRFVSTKNLEGRLDLWSTALDAYLSSPVIGIGYGQFQQYLVAHGRGHIGSHNTYLLTASELGSIGLILLLTLFVLVVRDGLRTARTHPEVVYLVAFIGASAGQALVTDIDNFRSLWITIGLIAVYCAAVNEGAR